MDNKQTPKLDENRLTEDQRSKLEKWQNDVKSLRTLEDIATMAQEMLGIMDENQKDPGRKTLIIDHVTGDDFVKILQNMQDSLQAFKARKEPTLPDYATPVVEAVNKLEKALGGALKGTTPKPVVNVDAPQVTVQPTPIDFRGVEKILKTDLPKAFQSAIDSIPKTEIPEQDQQPLLDRLGDILEQLGSIDTATRMKPQPGSIKINNTGNSPVPVTDTPVADNVELGAITANGATVNTPVTPGMAGITMGYYGTYATGASLNLEASFDGGSTYTAVRMLQGSTGTLGYVTTIAAVSNTTSYFTADTPGGATHIRVRCTAWAAPTGAINIVLAQTATRFATPAIGNQTVAGLKSNNTAVPSSTNLGVLPGIANAAAPTYIEGDQVLSSLDLLGNTRMTIPDYSGTGTIAALNGTVVATTNGCSTVTFNITGSWVATLVVEALINATWVGIDGDVDATDTLISSSGTITSNTLVTVPCASYGSVRIRASLYTSGTATVDWRAGTGLSLVEVFNTNATSLRTTDAASSATGSAVPTNAQAQGLSDGTNLVMSRQIANGTNSAGAGILAIGALAQFDDVSPTAITENQFGNLRMSANRNLYTINRDAAGNERGQNVDASNNAMVNMGTKLDPVNDSITLAGGLMPVSTALNTYSVHLTANGTTTPTSSTAYISSISISNEVGGTTSSVTIQDKQGTPLKLVNGVATTALTTAPTVINFQVPVKMTSGIDIIAAGAVAATVDIWIGYFQ